MQEKFEMFDNIIFIIMGILVIIIGLLATGVIGHHHEGRLKAPEAKIDEWELPLHHE